MHQHQRRRARLGRTDMEKMDVLTIDSRGELWVSIEPCLGGPPIVIIPPVAREFLNIWQRRAIAPPYSWQLIQPGGAIETLVQIIEFRLRNGDGEWLNRH